MGDVTFRSFWPNFVPNDNFFLDTLALHSVKPSELEFDLEITSVFPLTHSQAAKALMQKVTKTFRTTHKGLPVRKVWFTGENIRPPSALNFDSYISFDQDSYSGTNTYFPLIYLEILFRSFEWNQRRGVDFDQRLLTTRRAPTVEKPGFVCAFIGNREPVRMRAIEALSAYGDVDVFGPGFQTAKNGKFEIAKDYKFMLSFENDLYPGYITEKLLDAYVCGTIPLWRGVFGNEQYINRRSLVNANDFDSLELFAESIGKMSDADYLNTFQNSFLKSIPETAPLLKALIG